MIIKAIREIDDMPCFLNSVHIMDIYLDEHNKYRVCLTTGDMYTIKKSEFERLKRNENNEQ